MQHRPRFCKDSCQLVYLAVSSRRRRTKKGISVEQEREKKIHYTDTKTGHHATEDPGGTTQKRGTGDHAKDDPGGCCDSSVVLGSSSYLPIIVECCWTAASRSLSSIVHSPISEHPEKTRAQRHSVQIPPKKKARYFPSSFPLSLVWGQSPKRPVWAKKCIRHGMLLLLSPFLAVSLCALSGWLCAERAAPVNVLLCLPSAPTTLPHFSLSWESEGLITISPPIFDLQIGLMGVRAASGWREVGFNVLPALIRL